MKRLTFRLVISIITFALGVVATTFHLTRPAPDVSLPCAAKYEPPPPLDACFPGYSKEVSSLPATSYFPTGAFYPKPEHEKFIVEWYSKHLKAMGEMPLSTQPDSVAESYRFLWLRSFHHPVAVRVWRSSDGQFVNVKQLSGAGGYEPGELSTNETRPLTNDEWDGFIRLLNQTCYWRLPATDDNFEGNDGAQWILEGRKEGRYHVVDRWSPASGDFREASLYLLRLSNLGIDPSDKYVY